MNTVKQLIANGADLNAHGAYGESILDEATTELQGDSSRYEIIQLLLDHGADPSILDNEKCGPLMNAVFHRDTRMLSMLIAHGADPNAEASHMPGESLYDLAAFDYLYQMDALTLPVEPTADDEADPDAWLAFLNRLATNYEWPAPAYLQVLRFHGAMTMKEIEAKRAGDSRL